MKKLLGMALFLFLFGGLIQVRADEPQIYNIVATTVRSEGHFNSVLKLAISDVKPKSGVCPYYAKVIQYLPGLHVLNVEVYQENCRNDAYGISRGDVYWVVPQSLQNRGVKFQVLVNQSMGSTLEYREELKTFVISGN